VGLQDIGRRNEFGYWIARPYWGQGLATEAGRAFIRYCFQALALETIRAGAFADNPASLRVQRKLGFETCGAGMRHSLARGGAAAHIDTVLDRRRFEDTTR
jgi:RimJ/RimL family protein N-acetyltransferase